MPVNVIPEITGAVLSNDKSPVQTTRPVFPARSAYAKAYVSIP
ncbi:MAG: hypothetical protein WCG98_05660 [bacterium]